MKRNKTNLNFKNIFFFFFPPNCFVLTLISLHVTAPGHSSAIAISHTHRQSSAKLGLKQICACSDHQILLQPGRNSVWGNVCAFTEDLPPLNPCGPLQPYAGRGMEPTSLVADLQQLCAPRGEQEGPAMQETGQGPAGRINLPLRQPPCPVHSHWLESPGR